MTISGGSGNDTINNASSGDYSSLSGGSGNDSINAGTISYRVTLNGGYGNDTLVGSTSSSYGDVFQFGNHDDYDVITNYATNDTLHLTGLSYLSASRYYNSGSDKVISLASDGVITVKGAAYKNIRVKLSGGSTTYIYSGAENYTHNDGYSTSYNYQYLTASSSADSIYNSYKYVTISGGGGNDTINNASSGDYSSLSGGSGNDSINAGTISYRVTLNGGYGNDTLVGSTSSSYGDVFQFGNHDDYDVITNYATNDTLHLTGLYSLSNASYYNVGSDKVISLSSDGFITLKGAAYKNIKVKLANNTTTTISSGSSNYYSSYYEERWFMEGDDNFSTSEVGTILNDEQSLSVKDSSSEQLLQGDTTFQGDALYNSSSVQNYGLSKTRQNK